MKWSRKYEYCISCKTTEIKHQSKGLCQKCYKHQYAIEHSSNIVEKKRVWRLNNPDKFKEQIKRHNKTKSHNINVKRYAFKNRELLSKKQKERYHKNPDKYKEIINKYRNKNKDKIKSRNFANNNKLPMKDKCEICKSTDNLSKHHINYVNQDYITICGRCNVQIKINNLEGKSLKEILERYNKSKWVI